MIRETRVGEAEAFADFRLGGSHNTRQNNPRPLLALRVPLRPDHTEELCHVSL
ncbi:MAG TPA: hypothetical protein VK361_02470 [Rubrobacteraceae bacterium]|nr:hypothetical protein [Rubrobacteraceae bacterium]